MSDLKLVQSTARDEKTQAAINAAMERELFENERTFDHPKFGTVKIQRPSPRRERMIGDARRKQHHEDLVARRPDGTPEYLTRAELEKENIARGVWSETKTARYSAIQSQIGQLMGVLNHAGYNSTTEELRTYNETVTKLRDLYPEAAEGQPNVQAAVVRYFSLDTKTPDPADMALIHGSAPNSDADDLLDAAVLGRKKMELLYELADLRNEMNPLQADYVRMLKDSIESRMDRAESLAKVYYCASTLDGQPLWPTYDDMLDARPVDIELIVEELYYFERLIPDEDREVLARHGFTLRAPRAKPESESLPDAPAPSSSGESPASEPTSSSD